MKIIQKNEALRRQKAEGDVHYYLFADYEVIFTEQAPQTKQQWHHHETIWETIFIVDGELRVLWRDEKGDHSRLVHTGDLIETERSSHTFYNESGRVVRLMAIKHIKSETDYRETFKNDKILD